MDKPTHSTWGKSPRFRKRLRRPKSFWGFRAAPKLIGGSLVVLSFAIAFALAQAQNGSRSPSESAAAQLDSSATLPGAYVSPHPGADGRLGTEDDRAHVSPGVQMPICDQRDTASGAAVAVCYASNPPTSGPHSSRPAPFGVLDEPAPKESLLHNMEHGGVVIWYRTEDDQIIENLKRIVEESLDRRRPVVLSPYLSLEPDTIVLTAWTRLDRFGVEDFTISRVKDFIAAHERQFNPEGF